MQERKVLLEAVDLVKEFPAKRGKVHAVSGVTLSLYRGETLALVGESGCGKSTLGRMLLRLIEPTSGQIRYAGADLLALRPEKMREMRRHMQIIFQDPYSSLNPRMSVGNIIEEPLLTHGIGANKKERQEIVRSLMKKVGIRPEFYSRYPHQFSGGQRQRVGIARALALSPELIVCDEPVSALDVSIQAQILNLLQSLQQELGLTYLFISHDLGVVRYLSDRVCVMFLGKLCEIGETEALYQSPIHPYTRFLLESVPQPDPALRREEKEILTGDIPSPIDPPSGCRFHTRCPYAREICSQQAPELREFGAGRLAACHFPLLENKAGQRGGQVQ